MFAIIFLVVILISIGILGIGYKIWNQAVGSLEGGGTAAIFGDTHPLLHLGVAWMLGYFALEAGLSVLAAFHFFTPAMVLGFACLATGAGIFLLRSQRPKLGWDSASYVPLVAILAFVFFWNLYPAFDVDSLSDYFSEVRKILQRHGYTHDRFEDVRWPLPLGDNLIYSIGLALAPQSTLFHQLLHGVSKMMILAASYGAARSLGLHSFFALLAPLFIASEEHFVASGANQYVRVNTQLIFSTFLLFFSSAQWLRTKQKSWSWLVAVSALVAITCKYYGLIFLPFALLFAVFTIPVRSKAWLLLVACALLASIHYVKNWILTGSPVFPVSLGLFSPKFYDASVRELGQLWHYHLSMGTSLKNLSAFSTWPGILALKSLLPLCLLNGIAHIFLRKSPGRMLCLGLGFTTLVYLLILYQESYMAYEMRYYRFPIVLQALAAVLLLESLFELVPWPVFSRYAFVAVFSVYAAYYSFDVMGGLRPSAREIWDFVSQRVTESELAARYFKVDLADFLELERLKLNDEHLGYFAHANYPQFFYPLRGKNLAFVLAAGLTSEDYFDEGLFAAALLRENITHIYTLNTGEGGYPLGASAIPAVLARCGKKESASGRILALAKGCLETTAGKASWENGKLRLAEAIARVKEMPAYVPFQVPPYGKFNHW